MFAVPGIILTFALFPVQFILLTKNELNAGEVLSLSLERMRGQKMRLFTINVLYFAINLVVTFFFITFFNLYFSTVYFSFEYDISSFVMLINDLLAMTSVLAFMIIFVALSLEILVAQTLFMKEVFAIEKPPYSTAKEKTKFEKIVPFAILATIAGSSIVFILTLLISGAPFYPIFWEGITGGISLGI
jgi:hypothetical protein